MEFGNRKSKDRPRELRRRVVLPARLRSGAQWSDACILNISSREMMIHAGRAGSEGTTVELRRGDHVIIARVVWKEGGRAGLQVDDRLPVDDILSLSQSSALRLVASEGAIIERRRRPRRANVDARSKGRALELIGVGVIALGLALGVSEMAEQAFAGPLAHVAAALGAQP